MAQDENSYELATRSDAATADRQSPTRGANNMETDNLIGGDTLSSSKDHKQLNRQTLRKLDFILLPFLCTLFLLNSLDKSNIGNAETAGAYSYFKHLAGIWTNSITQASHAMQVFRRVISTHRLRFSLHSSSLYNLSELP